ncbi:MAG: TIGR01777 family oxidoreductase [Planctomycetes bacterium]|nr:TIGR01777 family oxidoreductase [Planctomycetota bacterium]
MRVLVTGGTGLIGGRLVPALVRAGHAVEVLSRDPGRARGALPSGVDVSTWDGRRAPPAASVSAADAVVHLAGEPVVGRWTAAKRAAIRDSRVAGTRALVDALLTSDRPPATLISASAIGVYGDRGDQVLDEEASGGAGFLAEVCAAWEREARRAEPVARVARLRIGLVLDPAGGALGNLLLPFRCGLGGPVGSGGQWWPWIHADDLVRLILWSLDTPTLSGALNATAPHPCTQAEFARALARVLRRPAWLRLPGALVRLGLGGMATELLASRRVVPARALAGGFSFHFPRVDDALADLTRPQPTGGRRGPHVPA